MLDLLIRILSVGTIPISYDPSIYSMVDPFVILCSDLVDMINVVLFFLIADPAAYAEYPNDEVGALRK